ncbi:uncharacterized protein N7446_005119 [Penicillium canescens]|uniref:Uncharacterized protein n=1 Tax=Penicillium canescens TaxID=5083 RepID=A0AAD6I9J9_PENCN|nr:uncharacterized protein N7446_005119 [Penicillium canescens]KAJ6038309.1 hypothetical protein N7460_008080 [Penicillium canescens]KAJ6039573.1 hypothetical protein N7444_008478 [Penicillium canescens]KAJ6068082.1 hypothetical protein N7446_005119 [Penicillium canescens]
MSAICTETTPQCPVEATTYGYYPNLGGNIFFTAYFGLLGFCQLGLGIYLRTWTFLAALGIGTFMEGAGYVGRILMHDNPWSTSGFRLQIFCLILAPTFIAAGIYLTLKHVIIHFGPQYSRMNPKRFTWIFIGSDVGSIVLQAAGGGVANAAGTNQAMINTGNNIIIAGIAFQVATMSVCGLLAFDFFIASRKHLRDGPQREAVTEKPQQRMWLVLVAMIAAYNMVLIRCIYRLPEMAGGWGNKLMQNEMEF